MGREGTYGETVAIEVGAVDAWVWWGTAGGVGEWDVGGEDEGEEGDQEGGEEVHCR